MKKKLQLAHVWEKGEEWYVVREIDQSGRIIPFSSKYYQDEAMAIVNFENRLENINDEIIKEAELTR